MKVVCTAGHVDHGKSTLVAALTGRHPDRWEEEQRRGLTIDLGFAWTTLDGIGEVAFVDLPGHERFVPNMLAGAGTVSVALLVVAADEGWMPQSAEHLSILDLLGVQHGLVALTRCDLVDAETRVIAAELVRDQLDGSSLARAPLVEVSASTGEGLDAVRSALTAILQQAPEPPDLGRPRLWIDRAFTIRGAGTVVTGTLRDGAVSVGDQLHLLPEDVPVRVRGMQALERDIDRAEPGWRVALNLTGVDVDQVARGQAVGAGRWMSTDVVDAWCRPSGPTVLGRRGAWRLHAGTAVVGAQLHPVDGRDLSRPGAIRIELDRPLPLVMGDRLVLREAGRATTIGGGFVLDPDPGGRVRGSSARASRDRDLRRAAAALEDAAGSPTVPVARLATIVQLHGAGQTDHLLALANVAADTDRAPSVIDLGSHLVQRELWDSWADLAVRAVVKIHQTRPALAAADKAAPRRLLRDAECPEDLVEPILRALVSRDRLVAVPGGLAAPGHEPRLSVAQQSSRAKLLDALTDAGFEPPPLVELAEAVEADQDLVTVLHADGQLVALPGLGASVTGETLTRAAALLASQHDAPFTAAQARTALGTTRKYALPLLEALDAAGLTHRDGDVRTVV